EVLPKLLEENKRINIWSAPCSNGSEPYTIAIILNEMGISTNRYNILASDLDPEILATAKKGIYGDSSIKNVPKDIFNKYFEITNGQFEKYKLSSEIKDQVKFEKRDLINAEFRNKNWHLIISRNFFIYLTKEYKNLMVDKFSRVLNEDGYFFIGSTEFIFRSDKFNLEKEHLSFYKKTSK
ncbi:MAG: CheR family methyltransferase, partial [Bacillota bacterium]